MLLYIKAVFFRKKKKKALILSKNSFGICSIALQEIFPQNHWFFLAELIPSVFSPQDNKFMGGCLQVILQDA